MAVKIDETGKRWVQVEVEVPGTPEQVWDAIATAQGVTSWFVPTEMRDDGTIVSHFGPGMDSVAKRISEERPHRFAGESKGWKPGSPPLATEWIIEARSGGTCIVRVVHSLFASTDEWDDQLTGTESGWPSFFRVLKAYLTYFRGQYGATMQFMINSAQPAAPVWSAVTDALGLTGAAAGERRKAPTGVPPFAGIIEFVGQEGPHKEQMVLRLDEPTRGLAHVYVMSMGPKSLVLMRVFLYGEQAAAAVARDEPLWNARLNELFKATV
jgi:uncharacterized protein YndB with AHSA1/START domain